MSGRRKASHTGTTRMGSFLLAESAHVDETGRRHALRITPKEIRVESGAGRTMHTDRLPVNQVKNVELRRRIRDLPSLVALAYLLAASVVLYAIVRGFGLFGTTPSLALAAICAGAAAVAGTLFWAGQELVLRFVGQGRRRRVDYPMGHGEAAARTHAAAQTLTAQKRR